MLMDGYHHRESEKDRQRRLKANANQTLENKIRSIHFAIQTSGLKYEDREKLRKKAVQLILDFKDVTDR